MLIYDSIVAFLHIVQSQKADTHEETKQHDF